MARGEFKNEKKAVGLITPRPRRWADRYGLDLSTSRQSRANLHEFEARTWREARALLIDYQCLGDLDLDFDDDESEEICKLQHKEARQHFFAFGYVECNVYNSLSSVIVRRA